MPIILLSAAEDSQILLKSLIGSFASSISLRVICYTDVLMDIQKATEICGKFRYKVNILVQDDLVKNAIVWCHMSGIEGSHSF
jgi:hypothetical protein